MKLDSYISLSLLTHTHTRAHVHTINQSPMHQILAHNATRARTRTHHKSTARNSHTYIHQSTRYSHTKQEIKQMAHRADTPYITQILPHKARDQTNGTTSDQTNTLTHHQSITHQILTRDKQMAQRDTHVHTIHHPDTRTRSKRSNKWHNAANGQMSCEQRYLECSGGLD